MLLLMPMVLMMLVLRVKQMAPMVLVVLMLRMAAIYKKNAIYCMASCVVVARLYTRHAASPASLLYL